MRLARTPHLAMNLAAPEIPAALCALGLAFAHMGLGSGATSSAIFVLFAVPVAWATTAGGAKSGYLVALATVAAVADDAVTGHFWAVAAELAALAVVAPPAMYFGLSIRREEREIANMQRLVGQRIARLKAEPGYWHEVATSRTGAQVTAIEGDFLRESLESREPGVVLDVGAGSGRLEFALVDHATHVIATEVDTDELSSMEDDPRVTPVSVGPMPSLPLRDATLGTIVAIEVPAVTEESWFPLECARTLKDDGVVLLMVYNQASYKGLIARLLSYYRKARGVRWAQLYYQRGLSQHLDGWRAAGFVPVRQLGFHWAPLPRSSNSPLVATASAIERLLGLRRLTALSPWVLVELRRAG